MPRFPWVRRRNPAIGPLRLVLGRACLVVLLALCLPPGVSASPYGINAHVPDAGRLDRAREAGLEWIRCDFNWYMFEPAQDEFSWSVFDTLVAQANARGIKIFATIAYAPGWANGGQSGNVPPSNPADWYDAVYHVVSRYRGSIHHWGMWNEPNLTGFFTGTRTQYIQDILVNGASAVKAADPSAFVLGPELAHLNSGKWDQWLREVLLTAGPSIDIVTHHIYGDNAYETLQTLDGPAKLVSVKDVIDANGGAGKPFWLTETGWTSNEVGEPSQADYYLELLDGMNARPYWERVFFYELMDDPNIADKWGIVGSDLTPKESFFAYQDLIDAIPGGGRATLPPEGRTYEAESAFNHQVGRADSSAWTASVALDPPGYLAFGPYTTTLPGGLALEARFRLRSSSNTGAAAVARIDVQDATRSRILAQRTLKASDFAAPGAWTEFSLKFAPLSTHAIELRTYFEDATDLALDRVTVLETGEWPPAPTPTLPCGGVVSGDGSIGSVVAYLAGAAGASLLAVARRRRELRRPRSRSSWKA